MKKLYQKEWFGINFSTFSTIHENQIADQKFYEGFYNKFFEKYSSYEELPNDWKKLKREIFESIYDKAKGCKHVLSIGCGIGYVENLLSQKFNGSISAIEPSENDVCRWLSNNKKVKVLKGYFPEILPDTEYPDFCFLNALDYVFSENEFVDFLKKIRARRMKKVVLYSASFYQQTLLFELKHFLKIILGKLRICLLGQLWGFQRNIDDYRKAFKKAGFDKVEDGFLSSGTYWISGETN